MEGKRFLHSIRLKNLLSYGSEGMELELQPLNVLVGPNNSGKSNLIEAISILAAAPDDLTKPFRRGGGVEEWLWKGAGALDFAELSVQVDYTSPISYKLAVTSLALRALVLEEQLESQNKELDSFARVGVDLSLRGYGDVSAAESALQSLDRLKLLASMLDRSQSLISQIKNPLLYPLIRYLGESFARIQFYRSWDLDALRAPQAADLPSDFLLEKGYNLGLVLNDLQNRPATWKLLLEKLRLFYERVETVTTKIQGGTIQILFHEEGLDKPVPAVRLSDGTLHYLCLLAVLCHPEPPPLICIEEPEVGLHPDILPKVAEMLIEASQRTQLIVTTHSETLVSHLSEIPEAVVVCERHAEGSCLRRLEPDKLKGWLDEYMLGEVWRMGEIGGNRW